ncbi:MAG: LysM peptidoglycan-binding domain-containing protein [Rickettsiales bacterium]|jgi:hypothetical protein|nr:LysM peptidoglycan-binding domain-containing protein [Rickettsiales bacterium]
MEKKEPILTTHDNGEQARFSHDEHASAPRQPKRKSMKEKVRSGWARVTPRQKKVMLAILVCAVVIGITVWTISLFRKEKSNVATIESARPAATRDAGTKPSEKSFWAKLFSKEEKKAEAPVAPSFDIVRMEKGEAVIAGQAGKGDIVHILDNGVEIGAEKADENGQWVFIPKKALPVGTRKLSLFVIGKDGKKITSRQSAVLHVSKQPKDEVAVIMGAGRKSKVLKAPKGEDIGLLRVAKIDYDENGGFRVEGRAKRNSTVNLYVGGKLVAKTAADGKGGWSVDEKLALGSGTQVVRADMLSPKGRVARRVEYKFTPEFIDGEGSAVVVKKGDCLWNLALKEYGKGASYVVIFEGNKSQIKNPDLIYVGQVFSIPKKDSERFNALKESHKASKRKKAGK